MESDVQGQFFPANLQNQIRDRFMLVDDDARGKPRLYFENAGGSLRLKSALDALVRTDQMPDASGRIHETADLLKQIQQQGADDLRVILNATGGAVYASLTATAAMFAMIRAIAENVPGRNMVTTVLEHPSSFDAMATYAAKLGRELRVAPSNPVTGGVDVEDIVRLIDADTCVLCVIQASNISGAKLDIEEIVRRARAVKRDLFIVVDAVQHAPHGIVDLQRAPVDGINIAPYKFFGVRGSGFCWLSERAANLSHEQLTGKPSDYWDLGSTAPWQFAVLTEIVNYVCWLGVQLGNDGDRRAQFAAGMKGIELHERALLWRMLEGTAALPGLRRLPNTIVHLDYEDLTKRDLIVSIGFHHLDPASAVREYERRGVIVYERVTTSLFSRRMLESFGLTGAVRVSPLHCHCAEDIDKFLKASAELSVLDNRVKATCIGDAATPSD
ncbi:MULTISPECIES: aminotransferase class V-fold PLP-dependent enzyme [Paraburkholderia]|uniref:Cysteine desulfurase n=2 Tax=Paraburkholderia TaxID=1822464 RepID=A0ABN7N8A6_9BURK|nr:MULTISPECIES: aminotransferase class V-fold PLP-dependent enzyme [Paraburkholderia]MBK3816414.1 aminotransferase class V-fold PLP-dependent enzyme [Paraburkholderia aspalathi]CAE6850713.1 putative cysteine desulfurase [Paraburkholderia nemoris]CAE6861239.1 putative cysteine desulfurase [Paraburkholderia nemoris]SOF01092.1 Selenocysteine lyase/Cysteine desulfurase [Burkholderia sp. OK233]